MLFDGWGYADAASFFTAKDAMEIHTALFEIIVWFRQSLAF
jgi:hypothetical protein